MPDQSFKVCSICGEDKHIHLFNNRARSPDGKQVFCRQCGKEKSRKYYRDNQSHHKNVVYSRKIDHIQKSKEFVLSFLKEHSCIDCGERDPVVLDFDHVRGEKYRNISQMVHRGNSLEKIKLEIEKCEVRCANCHRRKTAKELEYFTYIMGS